MERTTRLDWPLATALALHACTLGGLHLRKAPPAPVPPLAPDVRADLVFEIVLDAPPAPPPALVDPPSAADPSSAAEERAAPRAVAPRAATPMSPPREAQLAAAPGPGAGAPGDTPGDASGALVAAPPGGAARGDALAAASLTAKPRSDSLPPPLVPRALHAPSAVFESPLLQPAAPSAVSAGGQVLGAARAVADTSAPRQGRGTISIETDGEGVVLRVSSSSPSWERFARDLGVKLSRRRLAARPGGHGTLVRLAVQAEVSTAPAILTGEAKAQPCRAPEHERDQVGRADVVLNVGCNDWKAFLPVERRRVSVTVAEERAL
jgi:hypothetical protein